MVPPLPLVVHRPSFAPSFPFLFASCFYLYGSVFNDADRSGS